MECDTEDRSMRRRTGRRGVLRGLGTASVAGIGGCSRLVHPDLSEAVSVSIAQREVDAPGSQEGQLTQVRILALSDVSVLVRAEMPVKYFESDSEVLARPDVDPENPVSLGWTVVEEDADLEVEHAVAFSERQTEAMRERGSAWLFKDWWYVDDGDDEKVYDGFDRGDAFEVRAEARERDADAIVAAYTVE